MEQGKGWKEITRGEETRDAGFVSRSSLPLQEGTSTFGEVRYHQGNRSHKGRHKGFTLFSSQEHHQGDPSSPLKVLFEVAQPSHKARVTPQHGGSQLHHGARIATPASRCSNNRNPPNRRLPTRIPTKGDLGLQGFPMETTPNSNPFGR